MPRVVSLIASATEIVCALGCEDQLVGRSHECGYPPSVKKLPVCTEPAIDTQGTSLDIDRRVKAAVEQSLSVYRVHTDLLRELRPDVILTQSHCDVCAVSQKDVEQALGGWTGSVPRIVSLSPNRLADVFDSFRHVAEAIGAPERKARRVLEALRGRVQAAADRAAGLSRPRVAFIEWIAPLMVGGNWVPELIKLAGGTDLFGVAGRHSPGLAWERLCEARPEIIVVAPCGYDIAQARANMPFLTDRPDWPRLAEARVYLADGNQFFNRPGPRLVESLEILAELFHPDQFQFGHEGAGWQRL
jgi:iron complex transport system substrate-binding protein